MATDIILDDGDGNELLLSGAVVTAQATDIRLDSKTRRINQHGFRRALVHDGNDVLAINYSGDYPGGTRVDGNLVVGTLKVADLVISHDITYTHRQPSVVINGRDTLVTINLVEQIVKLETEIDKLTERVKALEAKVH